jgi:N-acetylmuramic acid 6-phosphate etherase
MTSYIQAARNFVDNEKEFHHATIITEQSNPKTVRLSQEMQEDVHDGILTLLSVDDAIPPVAEKAMRTETYKNMVDDVYGALKNDRLICFSGCGASGRLSVQMDATWRSFWESAKMVLPGEKNLFEKKKNLTRSIITGGDRALVRSVEDFEDYISFGRRQTVESGLSKGDIFITLGECGMPPSANGSALESADRGIKTYFLHCNPKNVLMENLERSRMVFSHPGISTLELYVGQMAVCGSTRMQVTTIELLVAGSAMELAIQRYLEDALGKEDYSRFPVLALRPELYPQSFKKCLDSLKHGDALEGLFRMVSLESEIYSQKGLITYLAHDYLLDIFTDTTERTPTFSLPPFRKYNDKESQISWAYAKDPLFPSAKAWEEMLGRPINGLDWTREHYVQMGASDKIINGKPEVSSEECLKYYFGNEDDPSRYEREPSCLVVIDINGSVNPDVYRWVDTYESKFGTVFRLAIGETSGLDLSSSDIAIPLEIPSTGTQLLTHLIVKIVFNVFSTATMARMGRIWGNWMIQVEPTNKKLIDRSIRIISAMAKMPYEKAAEEYFKTYFHSEQEKGKRKESLVVETLRRLGIEKFGSV